MKVILLQSVPGLGQADEVKTVADGYAKNFLFTKNLAVPASQDRLDDMAARQRKKRADQEKDLQRQQSLAGKLDGWELEIREKVNKNGSLYAAVGPSSVAEALQAAGFNINKKQIVMKPIKEVGEYEIKLKFAHGLEADVSLAVLAR